MTGGIGIAAAFAGLMLLYFVNSPQFYQSDRGRSFQHVISFTNLLAVAMLTCAYMSRFVYPMLSLEGRKFWILGLLPLERERLLRGKFAFAATGSVLIGATLVAISDALLGMPAMAGAPGTNPPLSGTEFKFPFCPEFEDIVPGIGVLAPCRK